MLGLFRRCDIQLVGSRSSANHVREPLASGGGLRIVGSQTARLRTRAQCDQLGEIDPLPFLRLERSSSSAP